MIKVGDKLPAGNLQEFVEVEGDGCSIGPNTFDIAKADRRQDDRDLRRCRRLHADLLGQARAGLRRAGRRAEGGRRRRDLVRVGQRPFVMGAWARDQKTAGKVRMMADGSADFAKAAGLTLDLTARGMGVRSQRYSMLVKDGVVKALNVEAPGKFEVSDAETLVEQAKQPVAGAVRDADAPGRNRGIIDRLRPRARSSPFTGPKTVGTLDRQRGPQVGKREPT